MLRRHHFNLTLSRHVTKLATKAVLHPRISTLICRFASFRPRYGSFINGQEVMTSDTFLTLNSLATLTPLTTVCLASPSDVEAALSAATASFQSGIWSQASPQERYRVLNACAAGLRNKLDTFAEMESQQTGRAVREMKAQLSRLPGRDGHHSFPFP